MNDICTLDEIRDALLPIFATWPIDSATLFGSYAKGSATEQSDVDIVIDSRGQLLNMDFYGLLEEISERLGKKVDLFEVSEIHNPSPIYTDIQREGMLLYDRVRTAVSQTAETGTKDQSLDMRH